MFLATSSSSTKNVKKLAGVTAGKETAIGSRCKAQLLMMYIIIKSLPEGGGWRIFKNKKKCILSKYQKIRSQISILFLDKFRYLGAILIVRV